MARKLRSCDAKRAGKIDGRRGYPPESFDGKGGKYSEFEKLVASTAEAQASKATEKWRREEAKTLKELNTVVPELETSYYRFRDTLASHRQQFGNDVAPEPRHRYGVLAILVLAFLFLFEGGVNVFTFRFLREPGVTTVIIGMALAFLIPFSGFYAGRIAKTRGRRFAESAIAVTLILASVGLILAVAEGRKIGIEARKLNPQTVQEVFLIFLFMNVLFFAIAFWDGYASGPTYPRLQKAYDELRRRKRQYMNRRSRLAEGLVSAINRVRKDCAAANQLSLVYRQANRAARGNVPAEKLPKYFQEGFELPVRIPQELKQYLDKDDPLRDYEKHLKEENELIKRGEDVLKRIADETFGEGKK